jgi:signal transduction histidine kinase
MPLHAAGAAFVDRSGAVLAADPGFVSRLGVGDGDLTAMLRARAEASPALSALLAGDGPPVASVPGADGGEVDVERVQAAGGTLLLVRDPVAGERPEHALRSQVLGRVIVGVAHEIKNPLNAMSLRLALLADHLQGPGGATAVANDLGLLREQIGRVNELLRRLVDATDPAAPLGYTDLGALLADVAGLHTYEARRRKIDFTLDARPGGARTPCDPARVGRLVLALVGRALARTPEGGRFTARAAARSRESLVEVEHSTGDPGDGVGYELAVLTAGTVALGGRLERAQIQPGTERLTLTLPGNDRE